jgi:hypothetical protein
MSTQRDHYVTTTDGVTIGGTVHGHGPPLVFPHAVLGDGDLDWQALLPLLRWLLGRDLVDELNLLFYPVVLGDGLRLFPEHGQTHALAVKHAANLTPVS